MDLFVCMNMEDKSIIISMIKNTLIFLGGCILAIIITHSEDTNTIQAFEIISYIAQAALVVIAFLALDQIKEARKQNKHDLEKETIKQLTAFKDFIHEYDKLSNMNKANGFVAVPIERKDYDIEELLLVESNIKNIFSTAYKYYFRNNERVEWMQLTWTANELELVSTALLKLGVPHIDSIKEVIALTFCKFVEENAIVYYQNRVYAYKLYQSTIELYRYLKKDIGPIQTQNERIYQGYVELINNGFDLQLPSQEITNR